MLEFVFTLLFCASAILLTILITGEDTMMILCFGGLISVCLIAGSVWAASFSKRAQRSSFSGRARALGAGWLAGIASLSLVAFVILLVAGLGVQMDSAGWYFIGAYGLISLLGIPAIMMERRLKKSRQLKPNDNL